MKLTANRARQAAQAIAATMVVVTPVLQAQETADATPSTEEIVVTGTRTSGFTAADSPAPIQLLSADQLQNAGPADLIQSMATIVPSFTAQGVGFDMANQTLQAKLRGLSPNHVLILVDGKRRHTTANLAVLAGPYQGGAGSDLNFIPVGAIDHIEVLTDGAAAQYGTDAIAGVINIILKKNTSGGSVGASYGGYYDGGGVTGDVAANLGLEPGDGSYLNLTGEVHNHGHSSRGGIDPRVIDPANISKFPNSNEPAAGGYPYVNKIDGDGEYHLKLVSFNAGFDLGGGAQFYAFGTYGNKDAASYENYRQPNKVSYTDPVTHEKSYPFPYGFNPQEAITEIDYALTAGIKGAVAEWNWDLSSAYGDDNIKTYTLNSANAGVFALTDASPSNFYDGLFVATQWTTTLDIDRDFDVGLAGPLNVAFGAEYRRETYQLGAGVPDSYILGGAQSYPGFTPTDAGNHSRKNSAGYVDLALTPIEGLKLDAAGRYEHYSDFGNTTVGKLTGRYDFTPEFALRGTVSTGFRAPTLAEEYYSTTNVGPTTAFVQLPPNAPAAAILGLGTGLKAEKSTNYSIGFVFHPSPAMIATLDLYQISVKDRIVASGTIYGTINGTAISSVVTSAILANGNVLDPDVVATGSTGVNIFANGIDTRTRGADLVFDFPVDYASGKVDWSVGATYSDTAITHIRSTPAVLAGQPLYDRTATSDLTTATPKYVVNLGALMTLGKVSVNLRESIYGASSEWTSDFGDGPTGNPVYYKTTIGVTPITNLDFGYAATKELKLDIGATNLFNRYPPHYNKALLATYRSADDNQAVQINPQWSPFGIDGGFYYAKASYSF